MRTNKLFVIMLMGIFLISFASAFTFDNVKHYDATKRIVTVNNCDLWIGTCLNKGEQLAYAQLTSPLNVRVGAGEDQLVGEFTFKTSGNFLDVIGDLYLEDLKTGKNWAKRGKQIKYKVYGDKEIDDYETVCGEDINFGNGTIAEDCTREIVGSHYEYGFEWKPIGNKNNVFIPNTVYEIGIFVDVEVGDHGDWKPTFAGKEVGEWAEWTADLNVGLVAYWSMEDASGTIVDVTGNGYDSTSIINTINYQGAGKVNYAIDMVSPTDVTWGTNAYAQFSPTILSNSNADTNIPITLNMWIKLDRFHSPAGETYIWGIGKLNGFEGLELYMSSTNAHISVVGGGDSIAMTTNTGTWYMITVIYDGSESHVYQNGVFKGSTGRSTAISADLFFLGSGVAINQQFDGFMDEVGFWNRSLTQAEITQLNNSGTGITWTDSFSSNPPVITLNSPTADVNYTTEQTIDFNFTASDDVKLDDVKFYVNATLNQTNATGINNSNYIFPLTLGDGEWNMYAIATDNESQATQSDNITIKIDTLSPVVSDAYNLTTLTTQTLPINSTWHFNATDLHLDKCWYVKWDESGMIWVDQTPVIVTCNSTITDVQWTFEGNKSLDYCANDTYGLETCGKSYLSIYELTTTQTESNDPTVEGLTETWTLQVNLTGIPTTTAYLVVNGSVYDPTTTTAGTNGYTFEVEKVIPQTWGNTTGNLLDWYWNYTIEGVVANQSTDTENITVYELAIDDCTTYGDLILNMSLLNEEDAVAINETAGSNFEIDLTLTSKANSSITLDYSNTWTDDNNPMVCIPAEVLNDTAWQIDFTIGFDSTDHVWEFYYLDKGTLNSTKIFNSLTKTPLNFYDLLTADSTSFLFNYYDADGLSVDDSIVHVFRKYVGEGTFLEVERAKSDNNGDTIVHLVEEDVIYYFVISQYGEILFTSSQYTALCQATPCTIQIEASGGSATFPTEWDLVDGGAYGISASPTTRDVTLNYTSTTPSTFNLTVYKYESDGTYTAIDTGSSTGLTGSVILNVPQSAGNVSFFASVTRDEVFVDSEWVDFSGKASDKFGIALSLFIASLIVLTLGLMSVSEGGITIFWVILGVALSGFLGLINTEIGGIASKYSIVIFLIVAGALLLWKLTGGRK